MVATHTSDGQKGKVTDTDTTNINSPQTLSINRFVPEIIPSIIPLIDPPITDDIASSRGTLHARYTITSKEIVTDAACSGARLFRDHTVINWKETDGTIPWYGNTYGRPPRLTTPIRIGGGASVSPTRTDIQEIGSPIGNIGPEEVRNAQPLHTSIYGIPSEHRNPAPTSSKLIS